MAVGGVASLSGFLYSKLYLAFELILYPATIERILAMAD